MSGSLCASLNVRTDFGRNLVIQEEDAGAVTTWPSLSENMQNYMHA